MLCLERKRAERSRRKFLLVLFDAEEAARTPRKQEILDAVIRAADDARRDTDPAGWYRNERVLGIIFTELAILDEMVPSLIEKVHDSLKQRLQPGDHEVVRVSVHVFGDDTEGDGPGVSVDPIFYPDILHLHRSKKIEHFLKRAIDIAFSAAALLLLAPVFVAVGTLVKLTSKGPIFFKQERLGRFGNAFRCLKFRSMYVNNDDRIHQDFVKNLINGGSYTAGANGRSPTFKMTNDPRITKIGKFLRRSSLDEFPQFINVLLGDMSLVGPRPPLAYEFRQYDIWHRLRVLEVKPGITGLWQVKGRSRVCFDEMVRLDLRYAHQWSLWLDLQIIVQTPRAVISGEGAY